ncbi:MAG: ankyrin repeat domain-containing protein [Planctomycetales bacterium]|nr:ankyrin repeat domain-containing protein [bacterium]UNM08707.1 MAG: ankyrin repeat domain-containing protein [Planctomycetales bacterium]
MTIELPAGANIEFARKQAKLLLKQLSDAEAAALALAAEFHPKGSKPDWQLSDAQLIIARQYGCESWPKLKEAIENQRPLAEQANAFIDSMFGWQDARFRRIITEHPAVASFDIACQVSCGDHAALAALLATDEDAAKRKFPPLDRELVIYASYSLMHTLGEPYRSGLLRCVELLLEHGADPNAAYDEGDSWAGAMQACLYGATGHGNFPELARLLLEAGADPNDDECMWHVPQFMYEECLTLLLEFGGNPNRKSEHWNNTPLYFLLGHRTNDKGYDTAMRGVNWLLEHGADPNVPSYDWQENALQLAVRLHHRPDVVESLLKHGADGSYRRADGCDSWQLALRSGNRDAISLLREHGFAHDEDELLDSYLLAVMTADAPAAGEMIAASPQLLEQLGKHGPDSFCDAAERGHLEVVKVMLDNGWDVAMTDEWGRQPLHCAALRGFADVVRLLLEAGAPLDHHDKLYNGAPIGWALHGAIEMPAEDGDYLSVVEQMVAAGGLDYANDRAWAERDVAKVRERYGVSRS